MDKKFIGIAINEALKGQNKGEIPIGAIIISDKGNILAKSHNKYGSINHAEILCINESLKKVNNSYLTNCTMYITLEPCFMCAGAIKLSRISKLVFGAYNKRDGAVGSVYDVLRSPNNNYNSNIEIVAGVMKNKCKKLLTDYNFI